MAKVDQAMKDRVLAGIKARVEARKKAEGKQAPMTKSDPQMTAKMTPPPKGDGGLLSRAKKALTGRGKQIDKVVKGK